MRTSEETLLLEAEYLKKIGYDGEFNQEEFFKYRKSPEFALFKKKQNERFVRLGFNAPYE